MTLCVFSLSKSIKLSYQTNPKGNSGCKYSVPLHLNFDFPFTNFMFQDKF